MNLSRKLATSLFLFALLVPAFVFAEDKPLKNVIIMIPDGMSLAPTTLTRWYKGAPLSFDQYACGLVASHNSDSTIADSAPSGSAYATGYKSQTGNIATLAKVYNLPGAKKPLDGIEFRPLATVLEAARLSGRSTGIVATSEFMHATPADFTSHDSSRKSYDFISEQIIHNGLDVILGAGFKFLSPEGRSDKEDMIKVITQRGYSYITNPRELASAKANKIIGLFAPSAMAYDLDRDPAKEPSLSEMTSKAISTLSQNKQGFFLMVEGSKIDWAAHANDPAGIIGDIISFDKACQIAFDYARSNKDTLVIVVSDHGNSGFSIGDSTLSTTYDKTPYSTFIDPLKLATRTGEGLESLIKADKSNIKEVITSYYGIKDLSDAEVDLIKSAKAGSLNYTVGPMLASRSKIGFTTNGHTGEDLILYVYDPLGKRLGGLVDNTEIAQFMAKTMAVNLDATTERLFVEAEGAFLKKNATVLVDDKTDPANVCLVVKKGDVELRIVQNRDYAIVKGLPANTKGVFVLSKDTENKDVLAIKSEGVNVFNGSKWFVSKNLIDFIK